MTDHYEEAAYSTPGQCWRLVHRGPEDARPMRCPEPVIYVGEYRLSSGRVIRVWSCEGHVEGVENREPVEHR